jgi:hypothetical protein
MRPPLLLLIWLLSTPGYGTDCDTSKAPDGLHFQISGCSKDFRRERRTKAWTTFAGNMAGVSCLCEVPGRIDHSTLNSTNCAITPNHLVCSDPTEVCPMWGVRSQFDRAPWYKGSSFDPLETVHCQFVTTNSTPLLD